MKNKLILWCVFFGICTQVFGQDNLKYQDYIYKESIKTVQLFPSNGSYDVKSQIKSPVIHLNDPSNALQLHFDDLNSQYQNYHVRILPCTWDWKPLKINEIEYISQFNDFIIQNYKYCFSTKATYYHYQFAVPKVKLSGNYLLVVHKETNKKDIVLSKRFMVNLNKISVFGRVSPSSMIENRKSHQQISFELDYKGFFINNAKSDLKVVIRQNQRWDNTIGNLSPTFDKIGESKVEYLFLNGETDFGGGNEFRFFDTRSLQTKMFGVRNIAYEPNGYTVRIQGDMLQNEKVYVQSNDLDGQFYCERYEGGLSETKADYAKILFSLKSNSLGENQRIFVAGSFNHWKCDDASEMKWDEKNQNYQTQILLKQGVYNYLYFTQNPVTGQLSTIETEGNHSYTQNNYEVFVYFKPFGGRTEQLVGYKTLDFNLR